LVCLSLALHLQSSYSHIERRTLNHLNARLYGNAHTTGGQLALLSLRGATLPPLMALELILRQA